MTDVEWKFWELDRKTRMVSVKEDMSTRRTVIRFSTTTSWPTTHSMTFVIQLDAKLIALYLAQHLEELINQSYHHCQILKLLCQLHSKNSTMDALRPFHIQNKLLLWTGRLSSKQQQTKLLKSNQEWMYIAINFS